MTPVEVTIAPAVLEWAIRRTGMDGDDLHAQFPKLDKWIAQEAKPTLAQARKLADKARIPFGRLLLEAPSSGDQNVADFRTVRSAAVGEMSPDLQEVFFAAQNRLAWYSDHAESNGVEAPSIIGSVSNETSPRTAAIVTRELLGFETNEPIPGNDKVLTLTRAMEETGLLVSRNSVVGNANRRALSVTEFRGFTIEDDGFALVFVNTNDAKSAQLFSLAHELGHVVRGKPGISDHSEHQELERWCNSFGAEFIAPVDAVRSTFEPGDVLEAVNTVARRFGLSREASLLRLRELGLVSRAEQEDAARKILGVVRQSEERREGGPQFHVLARSRVGELFFDTLTQAAVDGQVSDLEAARYLGVRSFETFQSLVEKRKPMAGQLHRPDGDRRITGPAEV